MQAENNPNREWNESLMYTWAGRFSNSLERVLVVIAATSFILISALVVLQVFARYVLAAPPSWTGELTQYVFIWLAWFSSAIVFRHGQHITIDAIVSFVPNRLQRYHEIFVQLCCVVVLLFLLRYGIEMLEFTNTTSAALGIDMRYVYASAPAASFVMLLFAVLDPLDRHLKKAYRHAK